MQLLKIPPSRGLYVLIGYLANNTTLVVGKLGRLNFKQGFYLYIGSAKGPGGLRARIKRHLSRRKKLKWHIDYLTIANHFKPIAILYTTATNITENLIVELLINNGFQVAIEGFGSTDDRKSKTHLLYAQGEYRERDIIIKRVFKALKSLDKVYLRILNLTS